MTLKKVTEKTIRKWNKTGYPHKGWECINVTDLEEDRKPCFMCGTSIRHVHHLHHSRKGLVADVGWLCSGHLTNDYIAADRRHKQLKKHETKLEKWLERPWREISTSNLTTYELTIDDFNLLIAYDHRGYLIGRIAESGQNGYWPIESDLTDLNLMKRAVFKHLLNLITLNKIT